jgi:Kef-type K+ transport system membrane component KefB
LLADVITSEDLLQKIHTIAYGLFVPVFFFQVGMNIDITMLAQFSFKNALMISLIAGLILTKLLSGYISSRLVNFSKKNSKIFGIASTAQLTTTLAAAYAASALGLIDVTLITAIVIMSVVTTIFSPLALNHIIDKSR